MGQVFIKSCAVSVSVKQVSINFALKCSDKTDFYSTCQALASIEQLLLILPGKCFDITLKEIMPLSVFIPSFNSQ
jgi:hypothetical protein